MENHPQHLGLQPLCEAGAFEDNQSFGVAVAVERISGSCSLTAEHVAAPWMGGCNLLVLGLLMEHVFQKRCDASLCKDFQSVLQQPGRDFSGGQKGTEGWMGVSEEGMTTHHGCFGYKSFAVAAAESLYFPPLMSFLLQPSL